MKTVYVNSLEVSSSKEVFCLILRFLSPNGDVDVVYAVLSPNGAKTLSTALANEVKSYEQKHGEIQPWILEEPSANPNRGSNAYVS